MSENRDDIKIPKGVIDVESYYEYLELKDLIEGNKDRFVQITFNKKKLKVDLLISEDDLSKLKIEKGFGDEIYNDLSKKRLKFTQYMKKLNVLREMAFGTVVTDTEGLTLKAYEFRTQILELFGKFFKIDEILKICKKEYGVDDLTQEHLKTFYKSNIEEIEEAKKNYESNYDELRLTKRKSRLDELSWLYYRVKDKYLTSDSREDIKILQSVLNDIKKEVDGDLVVNGKLQVEIEHNINLQVQNEMLKGLNISSLIVSKLAGKLGINPVFILSRLQNSIYAKFSGFGNASRNEMLNDDIYYPSNLTYDWNEIEENNRLLNENDNIQKQLNPIEDIEFEEVKSVKNKILDMIKAEKELLQKQDIEIRKNEIDKK